MLEWRLFSVAFLIGLLLTCNQCEGRAVNISNTWTLPEDGFAVFYRFFRDKISWFEADAVCQFHHANLVTVDNGQQFDAAREFLKVLDVTDTVWIGLMRPQNSERFTWSNSKPLASTSGYWAESLPLIESPLCAVIDPVRDFRWHALRCGGPETASFLCEMNVPSWALECTIRGLSNLTVQYMADNGSVELTRDCGGEEILHQVCKGKQDRQRVADLLLCKSERRPPAMKTVNQLIETHHKSIEIINNIPTDNNEDNNIHFDIQETDEKKDIESNPVQKLIEQFNVEELMQADQPQEIVPKPVKKASKKVKLNEKKDWLLKKEKPMKPKTNNMEEIMLGDQPDSSMNQIQEPLPHIKKSFPQDFKIQEVSTTTASIIPAGSQSEQTTVSEKADTTTQHYVEETTSAYYTSPSTDFSETSAATTFTTDLITERSTDHATSIETVPQSQATDEPAHTTHPKEQTNNHFIPPMLLVKSHYTSLRPHPEVEMSANTKVESTTFNHDITSQTTFDTTTNATFRTTSIADSTKVANTTFQPSSSSSASSSPLVQQQQQPSSPTSTQQHQIVEIKIGSSENPSVFSITTRPAVTTTTTTSTSTSPVTQDSTVSNPSTETEFNIHSETSTSPKAETEGQQTQTVILNRNEIPASVANTNTEVNISDESPETMLGKASNKFSNEENFQPYRPNRRRSLTKHETTNYLKKILG